MSVPLAQVARQALEEYGLGDWPLSFLRHGDNATFHVAQPGGDAFLLRLHVPVTAALGTHGADAGAVNSELLWLEALGQDTDLVLPQPVRNRAGALVTTVLAGDGPAVHGSLLRWVDGQPYHRDLETEQTSWQIGTILARLHLHASAWALPPGFTRPRRDGSYFARALAGLPAAVADGRIDPAAYAELANAVALLGDMLHAAGESRQTTGIMHADPHKGNLLCHQGQVRLIDFSFCALGNYMLDLAIALGDMQPRLHPACLSGYRSQRALPAGHERLIEALFLGIMVGTFSHWVPNPRAQEALARKVPEIAQEHAARFNRGESFWFRGRGA